MNLLTTGKKVPPLIFYNLNLEKVVKGIEDGQAFVSYKKLKESEKHGVLTYMSDLNDKKKTHKEHQLPSYLIELKLNKDKNQKAD